MNTIERLQADGTDIGNCLREETLLIHIGDFTGNSCDARIIATIDLPDGRVMSVNRVIRLRFKKAEGAADDNR